MYYLYYKARHASHIEPSNLTHHPHLKPPVHCATCSDGKDKVLGLGFCRNEYCSGLKMNSLASAACQGCAKLFIFIEGTQQYIMVRVLSGELAGTATTVYPDLYKGPPGRDFPI